MVNFNENNLDDNNAVDADGKQPMFVLRILEKIKETRLTFSWGSVTVFQKIANYEEAKLNLQIIN